MMRSISFLGPLIAILVPYFMFETFHLDLLNDFLLDIPMGHFYIVSLVSFLASIIAAAVGITGRRIRNIQVSFLSLSFLSLGLMFSIHGLSTPNFIHGFTHLPGISAQLSMLLATIWIWLSSMPSDHPLVGFLAKRHRFLLPTWTIALTVFGAVGMIYPNIVDIIPLNVNPLNGVITILILVLCSITIYRYYQSYRYTRFPLQISIVYSSGWIMVSQVIMVRGVMWTFSWWIYHFLLLASMIIMLIGLMKQYAVNGTLTKSIHSLFTNDPFERITNSISPSVKKLVTDTEKKDTYTAGHTIRVTMYALKLAEELGMKPEQLRAIVQGGLVHDVGKIKVPDEVLNKPGKLLDEERALIEKHTLYGYDMCRNLGFMSEELSIIRSHHEKWDGSGYPDRLKGNEIPIYARIMAVADVYDALTSERSYRKAWTHLDTMKYLKENKGTHFEPECVDAWDQLCLRTPEVYLYPANVITEDTMRQKLSLL
jgi:putative nucleotidyltransferase with HDIG domain